ncbi:MAG TPA: 2-dehydropantoate 2-reductase N-terminal domain-containing protein [Myxococcota bacterium]|nr:2-dehydropantoate 2-reductase N-terminal domain-containing protein [Myxococcota bacterium]
MAVVLGAGAVGLSLGARLAAAGVPVLFVVRRAEVARAIEREGVRVEDPGSGEVIRARAEAIPGIELAAARLRDPEAGPILICVRANDTEEVADRLVRVAPEATVCSVQNHVDNEDLLAERFERVLGAVWRQTCTRIDLHAVTALGRGRVIVGLHPEGRGRDVEALAASLRRAGFDVAVSDHIVEDKWLKLCVNLMSAPNALVHPDEHETEAFVETKARVLEEARAVLAAAHVSARSCDGRDRSLDEEIAFQRASLARGTSARRLPVYNQIWAALRDRRAIEGDRYHRLIIDLGRRAGVPTPVNARVLAALEHAAQTGTGPESMGAEELLGPR